MSYWQELEKQKNITQMQTIAFASAAHEFRNPLNAISASLELISPIIKMHEDDLLGQQYFQIARSCSNLMLFLVRDILDYAQIESKSLVLSFETCNIGKLFKECVEILKYKAQEKHIELNCEPFDENDLGNYDLFSDFNRLKQILINLLSNSIKYTSKGQVLLRAEVTTLCEFPVDKKVVQIYVEDTGVGMSEIQVQNLFKPFTKIMQNRNLNKEGVGLGLTISMNIANALGGDIKVSSIQGSGSKFIVELPLRLSFGGVPRLSTRMPFSDLIIKRERVYSSQWTLNALDQSEGVDDPFFPFIKKYESTYGVCMPESPKKSLQIKRESSYQEVISQRKREDRNNSKYKKSLFHIQNKEGCAGRKLSTKREFIQSNNNSSFSSSSSISKQTQQQCECPRILLVDDEPFNLIVLSGFLIRLGVSHYKTAPDGVQALDIIEKSLQNREQNCLFKQGHQPYQLVFIDNQMPIMTGKEVVEKFRLEHSDCTDIHFILTSGENVHDPQHLFTRQIIKPIDPRIIEECINEYVKREVDQY
ncbi:hypothetical protein FGO68_gene13997 [Halteria grandinella]|uniref:Uncharacterized protein n=1 Tax=Halteria grandinella TaxID=5974 RepID=A0A8J8P028_HALGN|nr:hypothetical protein FGO68_gene13997 [Halteria grandinella]